jgi:hypothetical protein
MYLPNDIWIMISSLAAVSGVIVSAVTFYKSYSRLKETEQIKIADSLENRLHDVENRILEAEKGKNLEELKDRYIQYLNVWEFFSLLIRDKKITMPSLLDYYKPTMLDDYKEIFNHYPDLKNDNTRFKEFKTLSQEWEKQQKEC